MDEQHGHITPDDPASRDDDQPDQAPKAWRRAQLGARVMALAGLAVATFGDGFPHTSVSFH